MAVAHVQSRTAAVDATSGTSTSLAYSGAVVATDFLLALCFWDSTTATCQVGDSVNGTNSWTALGSPTTGAGGFSAYRFQAFRFASTGSGTPTVTMTTSATTATRGIELAEYSGAATVESTVYGTSSSGAGTTWTAPTATPSSSTDGVIVMGHGQVNPSTVASPFTLRQNTNAAFLADNLSPTGGTGYAASFTVAAGGWDSVIASIVLAPAGGGGAAGKGAMLLGLVGS